MLFVVVASEKGSPGNAGFKMAVTLGDDESGGEPLLAGTIGGGIMERNLISEALAALHAQTTVRSIRKLHHYNREGYAPSGLICAGSQTIVTISLASADISAVERIFYAFEQRTPLLMRLSPQGLMARTGLQNAERFRLDFSTNEAWNYEENCGQQDVVFIVGGGHVGTALSRQMAMLDFHVVVFDDRTNVPAMRTNAYAHELLTVPYTALGNYVQEGNSSYVVIVTTSYPSDVQALVALASKNVCFIGLMGSAAKIKRIFAEAEAAGISREQLARVHAPVGVQVNSDTPEEIAVSIAAEIIGVKNTRKEDVVKA